jgi:hypothetical protein
VYKLMATGLSFPDAAGLDDASAALLIEAWEIGCGDDEDEGFTFVFHGPFEG